MSFLFEYGVNGPISAPMRQQKGNASIADSDVKGPLVWADCACALECAGLSG
jgi:hypothetical protein